jgi:hypothetical protein
MYTVEDLANAIAILSDADLEDNEIDQIDEFVIHCAEQKSAIEQVLDTEAAGEMGEEETDAAIAQIITDGAQNKLDIFDLEIHSMDDEEENYSASSHQTISFSQGMGMVLSNLIAEEYQTPEAGKNAIASATGLSITDVDRMILGEVVPDTDAANSITACFSATQKEQGFKEFMSLAANAINEVALNQNQGDSAPTRAVIQNSSEINQLKAEFNALKQQQELGDVLRGLDRKAMLLVQEGRLTPFEKKKLFGETLDKEEGVALFSAACSANNVSPETQVDRITYYLSVAADRGEVIQFNQYQEPEPVDRAEFQAAAEYSEDYFKRNGFI